MSYEIPGIFFNQENTQYMIVFFPSVPAQRTLRFGKGFENLALAVFVVRRDPNVTNLSKGSPFSIVEYRLPFLDC